MGLHIVFIKATGAVGRREALGVVVFYISCSATGLVEMALPGGKAYRPTPAMLRCFAIPSALGYLGPIFGELPVTPRIDVAEAAGAAGWPALAWSRRRWRDLALLRAIGRAGAVFVSFTSHLTIAAGVPAGIAVFGERPGGALAAAAGPIVPAL